MSITERHRRFLVVEQALVPAVFNLLINGAIAWALFRSAAAVPLWGESSLGVDLLATGFLLPFLTCLIVSRIVAGHVRDEKLPRLAVEHLPLSRWFERPVWARGAWLGALGVVFAALPVVWALDLGEARPMAVGSFVAFKAIWAAGLALVITPFVGWWALASASVARS